MGRTVINETENKQTVILNDSAEGVSGGYFDSLMEWHDMNGTSSIKNSPLKSPDASLSFTKIEYFDINGNHYEIKQSSSSPLFLIIDNIYRNKPDTDLTSNQLNLRKIFALKSGSVVKAKVSNAVSDESWGIFLNTNNTTANTTELITLESNETEKEKETTITNDIDLYSIYVYANSDYNLLSFDLELFIDGERYI